MKSKSLKSPYSATSNQALRTSLVLAASCAAFATVSYAQTVEINPAGATPSAYVLVQDWGWNTPGVIESWTANPGLTLEVGTPTDDGGGNGSVKGTAANGDPNITSPVTTIATPFRVIIEMRVKKEASDTSRMELFWDDAAGGFAGARSYAIPAVTLAPDDTFKVVRVTFPYGRISTQLDRLRFDPMADADGIGKTIAIDYLRVYTENQPPLEWDTDTVTTAAQGGTGTWDQLTSNLWWDGAANTTWPAGGNRAVFGGTAGIVTIAAGGVNANLVNFQTTGYTVTGGPINLGSDSARIFNATAINTRINAPFSGTAPLELRGGIFVIGANNAAMGGPITQFNGSVGITNNNALGPATFTMGAGGNTFLSALDGDRTLTNNVIFAGNRIVIDSADLGSGLTVGNLTIDGGLTLNCITPGDLFLRRSLTINGVVSGSNNNIGLLLAGDSNTLTLNGENTFTGNVKWANNSVVAVDADASLGDAANKLSFNGASGTIKLLAAFDSAREITINGATAGQIDTNGFDTTFSGLITTSGTTTATQLRKLGTGTLTLAPTTGTLGAGGILVNAGTLKIASGTITSGSATANGVLGASSLEVNGGSFTSGNFSVGLSAGTATFTLNTGGTYINDAEFLVAFTLGDGVVNINGGTADLNQFSMVSAPGLTSTMNLNGGDVALNFFNARANDPVNFANAIINFNGSLIKAKSAYADFIETNSTTIIAANVQAGGAKFDTATFDITIKQPLLHDPALGATLDGGLTKSGLGKLTLAPVAGPNTYTGPTTVSAGTLAVNGTALDDTGKLVVDSGLVEPTGTEVVNTLFFGATQQSPGTWGATGSGATHIDDTRFSGTAGVVSVTTGPAASGFASWAAAFTAPTLSPAGAAADADFDGLSNSVEYVTGGDPRVSSQIGRPTSSAAAGVITFTFNRVDSSETPDVANIIQVSTDLVDWTTLPSYMVGVDTAGSTSGVVVTENGAAADTIVVTIPDTSAAKKFARLRVVVTP